MMPRGGRVQAVFLLAVGWGTLLLTSGYGDVLDKECRQRDAWSSHRSFVWDVAITVLIRLTPEERAMLESLPGKKYPDQRLLGGRLTVMRTPSLTYIGHEQSRATIPDEVGLYEYWYGQDYVMVVSSPRDPQSSLRSAMVIPTPSEALYVGSFLPPMLDELALALHPSFIAGANPLRVFAPASLFRWRKGTWHVSERRGNLVVLRLAGVPGVEAECRLDASKRFAPTFFLGREGSFTLEYAVSDWRSVEGWWIPSRMGIRLRTGGSSHDIVLTLRRVSNTPTDLHITMPRGKSVADLRHISPDAIIAANDLLLVQGDTYTYAWMGTLPPKGTLAAIGTRSPQPFRMVGPPPPKPQAGLGILHFLRLFAPPTLLILIGAVWYWRLRAKKVA